MGDNKEFEVKAQTRKQGGNGTIQQMATESRREQKKQKNKKCPKRQPSIVLYSKKVGPGGGAEHIYIYTLKHTG